YILVNPQRRDWFKAGTLLRLALPMIILAVPYLLWNYSVSGSFQQISGMVKDLWGQNQTGGIISILINYVQILQATIQPVNFNFIPTSLRLILIIVLLGVLIGLAKPQKFYKMLNTDKRLLLLIGYSLLLSAYYLISYGTNIRYWHLSVVILSLQILFVCLIKLVCDNLAAGRLKNVGMAALAGYILIGNLAQIPYQSVWLQKNNYHFIAPIYYMDEAAVWIKDNIPADARVGVWDAGYVGYFSERQVVNLDGLINGKTLYDYLKNDSRGVWGYILDQNINYISNYYFGEPKFPDWMNDHLELIHTVGRQSVYRNGETTFVDWYVWKVKP
ncbi:MAG: hypothetical protein LWX83_01155, partial [Anaerolineae bacterium]|nr:hypothetical protein [Anaerolineae bacterium]